MLPVTRNEGPIGMVVCPSRELARQTYDIVLTYCSVRVCECMFIAFVCVCDIVCGVSFSRVGASDV